MARDAREGARAVARCAEDGGRINETRLSKRSSISSESEVRLGDQLEDLVMLWRDGCGTGVLPAVLPSRILHIFMPWDIP